MLKGFCRSKKGQERRHASGVRSALQLGNYLSGDWHGEQLHNVEADEDFSAQSVDRTASISHRKCGGVIKAAEWTVRYFDCQHAPHGR